MECEYANTLMMKYMDTILSDKESVELNNHLSVCGICNEDYMIYKQLSEQFEYEMLFKAPESLQAKVMKEISSITPDYIILQPTTDLATGITVGVGSIIIGLSVTMSMFSTEIASLTASYPILKGVYIMTASIVNNTVAAFNSFIYGIGDFADNAVKLIENAQYAILAIAVVLFASLYVVRVKSGNGFEEAA